MRFRRMAFLCLLVTVAMEPLFAQSAKQVDSSIVVSGGLERAIGKKVNNLDDQLGKRSSKYFHKLSRQEEKILKQLSKVDSSAAAAYLKDTKALYNNLAGNLDKAGNQAEQLLRGDYVPYLDSLQTSLSFLKDAKNVLSQTKGLQEKLGNSLGRVKQLQNRLGEAGNTQQAIAQRQQQLKDLLSNYNNLPKQLSKSFGKYQQQAYYYGQQLWDIKEELESPDKLIDRTLQLVKNIPAFKKYWSMYSMLAQMFPTPSGYGTSQALDGLQTRASVQAVIQQQIGISPTGNTPAANPTQYFQQQLEMAQSEINQLKEKLDQIGISSGDSKDLPMHEFMPNKQKTKSIWKRLEFGSNFQTQKSNTYFPTTTDYALSGGFKISDRTTAGLEISGRMGWGHSWKNIRISGEGIGFRSWLDWKAPDLFKTGSRFMASLWFTAGAEINYNKRIEELTVFKNYNTWNTSALAGLTKKYSMKSPLKRGKQVEGKVQLLYDFLHRQHVPPTSAFVWRVGWGL